MRSFYITLLLLFLSCKEKQLCDCYHGYVFDEEGVPLANVKVYEEAAISYSTFTDAKGYFNLERDSFIASLIFEKEGYITDTIRAYTANRRGTKTLFVNEKPDTLFMREDNLTLFNGSK